MTLFGKTKPQAHLSSPNIYFLKKLLSGIYARRKGGGWGGVENRYKHEQKKGKKLAKQVAEGNVGPAHPREGDG